MRGTERRDYKRARGTFLSGRYIHHLDGGDGFTDMYRYAKKYQTLHFKYVQFAICQLHLNEEIANNRSIYDHTPVRAHLKQDKLYILELLKNKNKTWRSRLV